MRAGSEHLLQIKSRFAQGRTFEPRAADARRVRALPKARREPAAEALSEIADEEIYKLSDDERAVTESALERAKRSEFASDVDIDEVLNKPWS